MTSLTEKQRFPLMTNRGRALLRKMQEHRNAPKFNFPCGDRLDREGLGRVQAFDRAIEASAADSTLVETEASVLIKAAEWYETVPRYRRRGPPPSIWQEIPTISRDDLRRAIWDFVPDPQLLDDLIVYYTSGTTGTKLHVLSHPVVSSMFLSALKQALKRGGVNLGGGPETVAIMQVCSQKSVLTHAAIASFLDEAGYVKINLNPSEWKARSDIGAYIDEMQPQILTGDPISFLELAGHAFSWKPRALVSSAMTLFPETRVFLEKRFGAPVLDIYSLNECRFIAASFQDSRLEVLLPDLFVEILHPDGTQCPDGTIGEITVTCGRNPFLPLLRYRTGDFASLSRVDGRRFLSHFSGRNPVLFYTHDGRAINNIDIMQILKPFLISRFSLHQNQDLSLRFTVQGIDLNGSELKNAFQDVFGNRLVLHVESFPETDLGAKAREFSSDIPIPQKEVALSY